MNTTPTTVQPTMAIAAIVARFVALDAVVATETNRAAYAKDDDLTPAGTALVAHMEQALEWASATGCPQQLNGAFADLFDRNEPRSGLGREWAHMLADE